MRLGVHLLAWWRLSRPEIWMVSVLPFYVGYVLASRELVPAWPLLREAALLPWIRSAWPFVAGAVVLGPLLWTATLLINDVHDLPGDRLNPRKARSPLVKGVVGHRWAHAGAYVAAAASLGAAVLVGRAFALCVLANLALAWAYSVTPVRLKTRPGADLLVNAVGVGAVSALAGWTVVSGFADAPWAFLPQGLLVAAAVYVPTTLVDLEADRAAGYPTLATHLGRERAYRIGWWCWVASNLGAIGLAAADLVIPRAMLPVLGVFVPVLLAEYHVLIGKARHGSEIIRGILVCSLTFLAVNLVFALLYTGVWSP